MSTTSLIFVCVVAALLSAFLKQYNPTYSVITVCAATVLILIFVFTEISRLIEGIFSAVKELGETLELIEILVKAVCICILAEIAGGICKDSGNGSIAACVDVCTKIILAYLSFPLINYLISIIQDMFKL